MASAIWKKTLEEKAKGWLLGPFSRSDLDKVDEIAQALTRAGVRPKQARRMFNLGILSGAHIGFGAFLMLSVGGACPGRWHSRSPADTYP